MSGWSEEEEDGGQLSDARARDCETKKVKPLEGVEAVDQHDLI